MSVVIVMLAIHAIKAQLLAGIEDFKAKLPDPMKPLADQVAVWISNVLDSIDAAALAASLPGQVVDLLKSGHGPSSAQPGDVA